MMALATPIVEVFYGREWHAAVHPLMFVAIWTGLASMASMPGAVFKATGRSWLLTATGIMQLAVLVPAVFISVHWGITAVAASQVIEKTISLTLLGIVVAPVIRVRWYASWVAAAPPIVLSAITGAIVYWIARVLPPVAALLVGIPVGVWIYAVLFRVFMPDVLRRLSNPLTARIGRRRELADVGAL